MVILKTLSSHVKLQIKETTIMIERQTIDLLLQLMKETFSMGNLLAFLQILSEIYKSCLRNEEGIWFHRFL